MHRRSWRFALLIFAVLAATSVGLGCGASPPPRASSPATKLIPASQIGVPLETARTPEGARGADQTHYTNAEKLPLTLTGSSIHIDSAGLTLIENFEEVQKATYCPYWDAYGRVYTRGFGETDWSGNFGGVCISHARAESNLAYLVEADYQYAVRGLGVSFTHHQVDALDSFVWNLGAGIFTGSLRTAIQHHDPYPMLAYDRAGGVVLSGLARRRQDEVALFLKPEAQPESASQRRAREKRELSSAQGELVYLRHRILVLRRELKAKGCYPRFKHHDAGPICRRYKQEGNEAHGKGLVLDARVKQLERALG